MGSRSARVRGVGGEERTNLEGQLPIGVEEKILGQTLPVLSESDVDGILSHRPEEADELVEQGVLVSGVL